MSLSAKQRKILTFVAQILLPAMGTLYFGLAAIWNLPAPEKVIGTITVVDTFLGVLLGLTTKSYAGTINVVEGPDKKVFTLELDQHPDELQNAKEATFKIAVK